MKLTVGSLFSGVGGLDLGLERAGFEIRWQCEVDEFCLRVLEKHWPGVRRYGDIRELTGDELEPTNLVCGGFPCQDLSVAGKRAGLAGERSGLYWEFHRLVAAIAPRWILIENVPGLLSSNGGRDFRAILDSLVELGYGVAWRILDAEYFGVAQRRRRAFIVGCLGDRAAAAKVLFEPESCERDTPPGREAGKDIARALTSSTGGVSGKEQQATYVASTTGRGWWNEGFGTLRADAGGMEQSGHLIAYQCHVGNVGPMGTLRQGTGHLTGGVPFVAHTLRAEGHDASEDGLGRQTLIPVVAATLSSSRSSEGRHGGRMMNDDVNLVAIQDVRGGTRDKTDHGQGMGIRQGGPMYTLSATEQHAVARPLRANRWGGSDSHGDEGNVILAFNPQTGGDMRLGLGENPTALHAGQAPAVCGMAVRRLTPVECERLQGLPDGWTSLDGKTADSPRYRALGNAVCVPVAAWIGRRIMEFEEAQTCHDDN